jgi:membrane associated rhomboid family serine protease
MVRRSSAGYRERSAAVEPRDDEDASIATSRISLDAPGRRAKEFLASNSRGRKIYMEHHQKGTHHRHRSRPPSVEERNPQPTIDTREHRNEKSRLKLDIREHRSDKKPHSPRSPSGHCERSSMSPRKAAPREREPTPEKHERRHRSASKSKSPQAMSSKSPREDPPRDDDKQKFSGRSRSKSAVRTNERSRSSSPRKTSKKEPLLTEKEVKRSSSIKKQLSKRIRSLKLRILDDDEDQCVPEYKPPVIPDHDSHDDDSSSGWDKYSVTATPGDSIRMERSKKSHVSSFSRMKNSEIAAWKQIAEEAETLTWAKDASKSKNPPTQENSEPGWISPSKSKNPPTRENSESGWISPVETPYDKNSLPLDPLGYSGSFHDEIESVWSEAAASERKFPSKVYAKRSTKAARGGTEETVSKEAAQQLSILPVKDNDEIVDSPRKATSFSDMIKSRLSSRDVDSVRYINANSEELWSASEDGIIILKQRVAYLCIAVSAIQMGLLIIQLCLCGLASLSINPMIGPFPDAFSEWGGKNVYLMLEGKQYFRIITPIFLHVGVIHLLINAYCQLETCAYFEREWGSGRWLTVYLISGIGSVLTSSALEPDLIGVCSSGALMGMFGAKIVQVITWSMFELKSSLLEESARFDHLGGVLCSAAMVSMLSFFTYIDWSGHLGGLFAGFLAGMTLFAKPIASRTKRAIWGGSGILGMVVGSGFMIRVLSQIEPDEELGDACQYFRSLYPDGYVCECVWE